VEHLLGVKSAGAGSIRRLNSCIPACAFFRGRDSARAGGSTEWVGNLRPIKYTVEKHLSSFFLL
jgi:hypothetical protein